MTHPKTRAERRNIRRLTIKSGTKKAHWFHWFANTCTCWPLGYRYSRMYVDLCDIHDYLIGNTVKRNTGKYAKTGPYNWYKGMEPDWFMRGKLRRDYRAGGGRRAKTADYGGGVHEAGRFFLPKALAEWQESPDIIELGMADSNLVEIMQDGVHDFAKGDVVSVDKFPEGIDQYLASGAVQKSDRKTEKVSPPPPPTDYWAITHPGAVGIRND